MLCTRGLFDASIQQRTVHMLAPVVTQAIDASEVEAALTSIADSLGVDREAVGPIAHEALRLLNVDEVRRAIDTAPRSTPSSWDWITINRIRDVGLKAKTVKIRNLTQDLRGVAELTSSTVLTSYGLTANPILIAAGVIATICSITRATTIELSEQEASVFWGMIQASGRNYLVEDASIERSTNDERERLGLNRMTPNQIRHSLEKLESIHAIKRSDNPPNTWRIIEGFTVVT